VELFKKTNYDFLGKARYCIPASLAALVASAVFMVEPGIRYGVEFSGGTQVIAKFERPPEIDKIRGAVSGAAREAVIQSYDSAEKHQVMIRVSQAEEASTHVGATRQAILDALETRYAENRVVDSTTDSVGPIAGAELRGKALQLTLLALFFQLLYIGWRFKGPIWGAAATIAVFHDCIIALGLLALIRYDLSLNVIAALLTLVGFQVNDTIVVFDRVRENLRQNRREPLAKVMNDSLNQTLSRTIISNGTAFLAVLGLFLFGGEVLRPFGFVMLVGILVGTYSTVYVASPLVIWWTNRWKPSPQLAGAPAQRRRAAR
jgi:preprotein translocase subunit SecF